MSDTNEMFEASNGWKVETGPHHPIRAIYNPEGRDTLDDVLILQEILAVVEFAATIGIHAPSEEREPLTHEMLHTILGESVLTVRGDHGKSYIVEEQHFDDLLEALQGKVELGAPTIDADTLNAIILKVATRHTVDLDVVQMLEARGFEVASLRNFMEVEARSPFARERRTLAEVPLDKMTDEQWDRLKSGGGLRQVAELPTIYKSEDDQGRPVLDGPMIQAVCQTISQMFGPHFVMTTSGGLRTPGEAGLDTAEWEEFRAWKAQQKAEAIAKRTEAAVNLFVYRDQVVPRWEDVRDELRNIVRLANAGEIDFGEPDGENG